MLIFRKAKNLILKIELKFLGYRISKHGYHLIKNEPQPLSEIIIRNFYKTQFKNRALVSYLVSPFIIQNDNSHSNIQECKIMADILSELGFNVDIINWDNDKFIPDVDYQIVIDNHNNLYRLSNLLSPNCLKIFHATNAHWLYQNSIEYKRYNEFYLRSGISISPPRLCVPGNSAENCDVITMFGNEFTRRTYGKYSDKVYQIPMSITTSPSYNEHKDFNKAKFKFLWLNSHGALLKGLDVIIELFRSLPECHLYICCKLSADSEFFEYYGEIINDSKNIHLVGWLDITTDSFQSISDQCAWVISSSFSEGGGGSILNCMAKGLIPIIAKSVSIDLMPELGYYFESDDVNDLKNQITTITQLSTEKLRKLSFNSYGFVLKNHTKTEFKNRYKKFLQQRIQLF